MYVRSIAHFPYRPAQRHGGGGAAAHAAWRGASAASLGDWVVEDVANGVGGAKDLVGVGVGDLDAKLLLDRHHDLHSVQAVQAQVIGEAGLLGDL